jgi:hypothetical protein
MYALLFRILFVFSVREFIHQWSAPGEYEHTSSKSRVPSNIPLPQIKEKVDFLEKGSTVLIKFKSLMETIFLNKTCAGDIFRKICLCTDFFLSEKLNIVSERSGTGCYGKINMPGVRRIFSREML